MSNWHLPTFQSKDLYTKKKSTQTKIYQQKKNENPDDSVDRLPWLELILGSINTAHHLVPDRGRLLLRSNLRPLHHTARCPGINLHLLIRFFAFVGLATPTGGRGGEAAEGVEVVVGSGNGRREEGVRNAKVSTADEAAVGR